MSPSNASSEIIYSVGIMSINYPGSPPPEPPKVLTLANGIILDTSAARSITDALKIGGATYTREQQEKLSADQKGKFVKAAIEPTFTKFTIIDFTKSQSEKYLEENFAFMTQVEDLRAHLQVYGLLDVFLMVSTTSAKSRARDILSSFATLPLEEVQEWSKNLYTYADQITLENLQLSLSY